MLMALVFGSHVTHSIFYLFKYIDVFECLFARVWLRVYCYLTSIAFVVLLTVYRIWYACLNANVSK